MNCSTPAALSFTTPWVCSNSCLCSQWCHPTIDFHQNLKNATLPFALREDSSPAFPPSLINVNYTPEFLFLIFLPSEFNRFLLKYKEGSPKEDSVDVSLSKLRVIVKDREAWRAAVHGVTKSQTRLSNWTNTKEDTHFYQPARPLEPSSKNQSSKKTGYKKITLT